MTILFKQLRFLSEGLTLLSQSLSRVRFSSQLSAGVNPSLLVRPNRAPNVYHRNTWSYTSKQFCRGSFIPFEFTRFLSDKSKIDHNSVKGIVYHSTATDVFDNLAFEDWVYNNLDLTHSDVLLLWCNSPCVVVGRHQNPWVECNHRILREAIIRVARGRSGGGTVYHDRGNLNCSFFTSRERYNRRRNLDTIISGINRRWPDVNLEATCRDDITLNKTHKISGSASKLGKRTAYHHCTLLHSCNRDTLMDVLNVNLDGITHKSTASVPSMVKNLQDVNATINHESLIRAISEQFYSDRTPFDKPLIYEIEPRDERVWTGVHAYREELDSWEWVYGKTPPFSIQRGNKTLSVLVHITRGCVAGVIVRIVSDEILINSIQQLCTSLKGVPFTRNDLKSACNVFLHAAVLQEQQKDKLAQVCSLIQETVS